MKISDKISAWYKIAKDTIHGGMPLITAVAINNQPKAVKFLLDQGKDIESRDSYFGMTPLMWASARGHKDVVSLLVDRGASIEAKDDSQKTALMWAVEKGRLEVTKFLLDKDANPNDTLDGKSVLEMAQKTNNSELVQLLQDRGAKPAAEISHDFNVATQKHFDEQAEERRRKGIVLPGVAALEKAVQNYKLREAKMNEGAGI